MIRKLIQCLLTTAQRGKRLAAKSIKRIQPFLVDWWALTPDLPTGTEFYLGSPKRYCPQCAAYELQPKSDSSPLQIYSRENITMRISGEVVNLDYSSCTGWEFHTGAWQ